MHVVLWVWLGVILLEKRFQLRDWPLGVVCSLLSGFWSLRDANKLSDCKPHFHHWKLEVLSCHSITHPYIYPRSLCKRVNVGRRCYKGSAKLWLWSKLSPHKHFGPWLGHSLVIKHSSPSWDLDPKTIIKSLNQWLIWSVGQGLPEWL